jgi:hypothetical protein
MSVHPSFCSHGTTRLSLDGFSWNFIFEYFSKIYRENSSFIKFVQEYRVRYMKNNVNFLTIYHWIGFRMRHVSDNETCFRQWDMFQTMRHVSDNETCFRMRHVSDNETCFRMRHVSDNETCFRMRHVSDNGYRENRINFYVRYFFFENRAVYEITWKNMVERGRPQMTILRMRVACWIPEATNRHAGCVTLTAFPQQQWLHERSSMLHIYTYIVFFC